MLTVTDLANLANHTKYIFKNEHFNIGRMQWHNSLKKAWVLRLEAIHKRRPQFKGGGGVRKRRHDRTGERGCSLICGHLFLKFQFPQSFCFYSIISQVGIFIFVKEDIPVSLLSGPLSSFEPFYLWFAKKSFVRTDRGRGSKVVCGHVQTEGGDGQKMANFARTFFMDGP